MNITPNTPDLVEREGDIASVSTPSGPPPWEEIEAGRFQPRRIKGSCVGRALG